MEKMKHLNGEVQMFLWTYKSLKDDFYKKRCGHERRALHESFLIHVRNLAHFLWSDLAQKHPNDIYAENISDVEIKISQPDDFSDFKKIFQRIHKQLAHLVKDRVNNEDLFLENDFIFDIIIKGLQEYNSKVSDLYTMPLEQLSETIQGEIKNNIPL